MRTRNLTWALVALSLMVGGCKDSDADGDSTSARSLGAEVDGTCSSTLHERSPLDTEYGFDLGCAVAYFQDAGCDFTLDPDGDGEKIASSTVEDMVNDPAACIRGNACTGCTDDDSIAAVTDCEALAGFSHFTESEWRDVQAACPVDGQETGCTIEGLEFSADESACALQLFAGMSCGACVDLFDSRVCEDALNDPDVCKVGDTCTGCDDGDSRDNGVSCEEIAAYSYFGPAAAATLMEYVQANPCEGDCDPACDGRECGNDGCGGACGSCEDGETCDVDGQCVHDGCTIEGIYFDGEQMDCAISFLESASCAECDAVLDSRSCEDAIDDPASCQLGDACTGCDDGDTRDDGVTCEEIAAYAHFGPTSAAALLTYVGADETCGAPDQLVEGVPLTDAEATAILAVANGASEAQLDDGAGLDARAAVNIVDERPHAAMDGLAAVPYVGQTAIEKLRDYAGDWAPEEEDEEPPADPAEGCDTLQATTRVDANATDLARLIELATMGDWPAFEVPALQASGCAGFMDDPAHQEAMMWAIWDQTYSWDRDDVPANMLENGSWTAGGTSFLSLLNTALVVIGERVDDGDWDPEADAEGAALYARRQVLVEALSADAIANPADYVEIQMDIEAAECSEEAVALLKLDDLTIVVIHWLPRC
jgi:hypothetical protein